MVKNDWSCLRKLAIAIGVIAVVLAVVLSASAVIDFLQRPVGLETTNGNQNPYMAKTELLYFWANILMFLVNLGLLLAALVTFVAVSRQLTVTQNQQWADIVLKLDERFEATDFAAERNQAEAFMDTIEEAVKRKLKHFKR